MGSNLRDVINEALMKMQSHDHLISPVVECGQIDIIDEYDEFLSGWRSIRRSHAFVDVTLNAFLSKQSSIFKIRRE